jgi:hypothetical protein
MRKPLGVATSPLLLIVMAAGCLAPDPGSPAYLKDNSCPPRWYSQPPQSEEYIYAVGWSGPTYKPSKAREQALTRAVSRLASQAETFIRSQMVISEDMNRVTALQLTESDIQGKIRGFNVFAEHRCFEGGQHESRPGSVYILIGIPKSELKLHR